MNRQRGQAVVLGAWLTMIALATLRQATDPSKGGLPPPSTFLASGVLFTVFYGGASFAPPLFAVLSVGVVVSAIFKPYLNAQAGAALPQSGPIYQLSNLLDGLANTTAPAKS